MNTVPLWVIVVGFAIPLLGLAGSAIAYVVKLWRDYGDRKHERFFELMSHLDGQGTIAAKLAAAHELRRFKNQRDFIIRFCDSQAENITGPETATKALKDELKLTADHLR